MISRLGKNSAPLQERKYKAEVWSQWCQEILSGMAFLLLFSIIHGIHQSIGRKEDSALRICVCFDGEGDDRRIKRNESDELFPLVSFLCLCVCEMSQCRNHTKLVATCGLVFV